MTDEQADYIIGLLKASVEKLTDMDKKLEKRLEEYGFGNDFNTIGNILRDMVEKLDKVAAKLDEGNNKLDNTCTALVETLNKVLDKLDVLTFHTSSH
jgi:uncharacterized phage infection (PIP) family protein YhgE